MDPELVGDESVVPGPAFLTRNHELQAAWQQPVGRAVPSKASDWARASSLLPPSSLYSSEAFLKALLSEAGREAGRRGDGSRTKLSKQHVEDL